MPSQSRSKAAALERLVRSRTLLLGLAMASLTGAQALGQSSDPGATDPMGKPSRYALFPDHELMTVIPRAGTSTTQYAITSLVPSEDQASISVDSQVDEPLDATAPEMVAASGRILIPDEDQVVYAERSGSSLVTQFLGYGSSSKFTVGTLPNRIPNSADFFDIAAGDLDKLSDNAGINHDEVVVVYASPGASNQLPVNVAVLDYSSSASNNYAAPVVVARTTTGHPIDGNNFATTASQRAILPVDNVLGVALGDFDGDDETEIAVVQLQNYNTLWVSIFRYTRNATSASLQLASSLSISPQYPVYPGIANQNFVGSVDVTAGDFNGDGADDLLLGSASWFSWGTTYHEEDPFALIIGADSTLKMSVKSEFDISENDFFDFLFSDVSSRLRPQVVSGLFKLDPLSNFDFNRREAALLMNFPGDYGGGLVIIPFTVSNDLSTIQPMVGISEEPSLPDTGLQRYSAAAGNFRGNADLNDPLWSIAVGRWSAAGKYIVQLVTVDMDGAWSLAGSASYTTGSPVAMARLPMVAYDLDGDSTMLGAPTHIEISGLVRTDYILQEPPKHLAYLGGTLVNVSRNPFFYVELKDSQGSTFSTEVKSNASTTIGGSSSETAGGSLSAESNFVVGKVSASVSADFTHKSSYDYNSNEESYNSAYQERTLTYTGQTNLDDYLVFHAQTIHVWRYRGYGISGTDELGEPTNIFYELVLPGPEVEYRGGGLSFDWYQPVHENGNILSYPPIVNGTYTPDDIGSFTLPNGTVKTEPMFPATIEAYDGTSSTIALNFSSTSGSGSSRSFGGSLSESNDFKMAAKESATVFGVTAEVHFGAEFSTSNKSSWSTAVTSKGTTSSSTGITLVKPAGDFTQSYFFAPVFYITKDGTIKASFAVDAMGNTAGQPFWARNYGQLPDPALNLPMRFSPVKNQYGTTVWMTNNESSRKRLRGFFLRKGEPNPVTGQKDYLGTAPHAGDPVQIDVRVYNYSVAKPVSNLLVRFDAVAYDASTDTEGARTTIGSTIVPSINPQQWTTASIIWNTGNFGPPSAGQLATWRIYAVLDPNNTIQEIYETEPAGTVDPGQNNEGYGLATVQYPPVTGEPQASLVDVSLGSDALALVRQVGRHQIVRTRAAAALQNQPVRLRVHVSSNLTQGTTYQLLVSDGNMDSGGQIIAGKLVQGVDPTKGSYVWVDWTPTTVGKHVLYASLAESSSDPNPGNAVDTLTVLVAPQPKRR